MLAPLSSYLPPPLSSFSLLLFLIRLISSPSLLSLPCNPIVFIESIAIQSIAMQSIAIHSIATQSLAIQSIAVQSIAIQSIAMLELENSAADPDAGAVGGDWGAPQSQRLLPPPPTSLPLLSSMSPLTSPLDV